MGSVMGNAICCIDAQSRKGNNPAPVELFNNTLNEVHGGSNKKSSKKSLNSEKETEPNSKPDHPKAIYSENCVGQIKSNNKLALRKDTKELSDLDLGFELIHDEAKDSVSDADESNDFDYLNIKPMQQEVSQEAQNFIGLSIPLVSVNYDSEEDTDLNHLEEKRHSRTCRNKKREVKHKEGDMTSKKRQKVAFEEIKESEDVMEDEPDNPAERDEHSQTDQDGTENIGGFGHFISSNGLSDESPSPPKIALNQQISTFSIFSKEEMKSSKFVQSESDKSINKLRNSEKEKRLLFEIKEYDIFDQTGCVSQTYKNSFEIKYEINSEYIFKLQNFFSKGFKHQNKYDWEEMKKANDYSIYCGNKGSLIHEESPVFMIKIKFDKKYSYEMIVDCMSSSEEICVWNKAITKCKDIIKFSNNTLITHTIYSPSFLIEKREFIEKRFVTSIKDPKGNKQKTLIFKSSVPNHLLSNPECKLHGTTLFSICMIKYESDTDQTTLTIIEQVHYGLKNIDKYTKVALPAQVDKMYRNLIEYMNRKLEEDAFSI